MVVTLQSELSCLTQKSRLSQNLCIFEVEEGIFKGRGTHWDEWKSMKKARRQENGMDAHACGSPLDALALSDKLLCQYESKVSWALKSWHDM